PCWYSPGCFITYYSAFSCSFFFQAEDGIRDSSVTGVQTCALPIYRTRPGRRRHARDVPARHRRAARFPRRFERPNVAAVDRPARSEERRVGKECRNRGERGRAGIRTARSADRSERTTT